MIRFICSSFLTIFKAEVHYFSHMIAFFKKIRLKLLAGISTSKYLAYAVGKIALVFIGILLVFQLNNWNAERQIQHELDQRLEITKHQNS